MKNTNCTDCGIRAEVAKAIGADIKFGKCTACRDAKRIQGAETVVNPHFVLRKRIAERIAANKPAPTPVTYGKVWTVYNRAGEWTPEIAEAMRIPQN
jgi:hypothetical protein